MNIYKKILLIGLLISILAISACTIPATNEPESNFPGEEEKTSTIPDIIPEKIDYTLIEKNTKFEGTTYIALPADEYGDESSINRLPGSTSFELATTVELTYLPVEKYEKRDIPFTIVDITEEKTIYTGELLAGTHGYDVVFTITHAGMAPRFNICFEDDLCTQYRGETVDNNLETNLNNIWFKIERDMTTKQIIVSNQGSTPLTTFIQLPEGPDYTLTIDDNKFLLLPNSEQTVKISVSGTKTKGVETAWIYAIPHNCDMSEECAQTAKIKEEVEISFS